MFSTESLSFSFSLFFTVKALCVRTNYICCGSNWVYINMEVHNNQAKGSGRDGLEGEGQDENQGNVKTQMMSCLKAHLISRGHGSLGWANPSLCGLFFTLSWVGQCFFTHQLGRWVKTLG